MLSSSDAAPDAQAERFACLYASHVSSLALYSPTKSYRCAVGLLQSVSSARC